jgi:hypothetical protein
MSYAVATAILIVLVLSLFDPRLALVAGTGLVLGLVASALWARAQRFARFSSWFPRAFRALRRVRPRLSALVVGVPLLLAFEICVVVFYNEYRDGLDVASGASFAGTCLVLGAGTWWLIRTQRQRREQKVGWPRRIWRVVRDVLLLLIVILDSLVLAGLWWQVAENSDVLAVAVVVLVDGGVVGGIISRRFIWMRDVPTRLPPTTNPWTKVLRRLSALVGVLLLLAAMLGVFMAVQVLSPYSPTMGNGGDGDVGPTFLAPRYEGTGVYRNDGWNLTDRIVFEQDTLTPLEEREVTASLVPQLRAQGWSPQRISATRVFVRTRRESAKARWFPATTSRQLQITMPAAITLPDGSELPFTPGEQSRLMLTTAPYVVGHTGPSASREVISGREVLRINLDPIPGEPADVQVQILSPLFRNTLGATLAGLSFGGAVKWIVLLGAAVGAEQIKQIILVPLTRLLRRFRVPSGEEASPSSQRRP